MNKRLAMMMLATALAAAACSSSSKDGSATLPSIAGISPTASASDSQSPSAAPSTAASSASASASSSTSPTASPTASTSASSSASSSPSASSGGGCTTAQLTASLGQSQGAAGSQISPLVLTNRGPSSCTLGGFPGVSFVTGNSGTQVGAAATRSGAAGSTLNLAPRQSAQALVKIANTDNYGSSCMPVTVRGLRVYPPGQLAALFVSLPDGTTACSSSQTTGQLTVQSLTAAS